MRKVNLILITSLSIFFLMIFTNEIISKLTVFIPLLVVTILHITRAEYGKFLEENSPSVKKAEEISLERLIRKKTYRETVGEIALINLIAGITAYITILCLYNSNNGSAYFIPFILLIFAGNKFFPESTTQTTKSDEYKRYRNFLKTIEISIGSWIIISCLELIFILFL